MALKSGLKSIIVIPFLIAFLFVYDGRSQAAGNVYSTEKIVVSDNVFCMVRPDWLREFVVGNITVIRTKDGLIVFDAGNSPLVARQAITEIKKWTDLPVRYLIVSHGHIDHTGGLSEFRKTWPDIIIIGHQTVYERIKKDIDRLESYATRHETRFRKRDSLYSTFASENHHQQVLDFYFRYLEQDAAFLADQYRRTEIVLPDLLMSESITIYLGDERFELYHLGKAHTPSDLALYYPKEKLLIAGDIITRPVPYGFSYHAKDWLAVMKKISELEIDQLIPGHGEPIQGKKYLMDQIRLFEVVFKHMEDGINKGMSEEEIIESFSPKELPPSFEGLSPIEEYRLSTWFIIPIIQRNLDTMKNTMER